MTTPAPRVVATSFLALLSIVGLCLYGLPFFYDFFVRELGWTRAQVTSGNAIGKLVIGPLFGFAAGALIDRFGPRRPMIAGVLLAGVALAGLGGVTTVLAFYTFYACNSLAYVLAGPLPNQVLLSRRFLVGRGRAMGIAYLGIGIGFAIVPLLSAALVEAFGWRTALRVLAVVVVLVALPLTLLLRDPPPLAARGPRASLRQVVRSRSFHLLLLGSMASIGAVGGAIQHLKMLLTLDRNHSQAQAATVMSVVAACSLVGRLGAGALADRIGPKKVMLLVYLTMVVAMLLLVFTPPGPAIWLFAVVFGLALGGEYLIIPLMAAELFGTAVLGRVMGIVLTADGVAEAVFPVIVGRLRDVTGSYRGAFQLLALVAALGAVAIAALPRQRAAEDPVS